MACKPEIHSYSCGHIRGRWDLLVLTGISEPDSPVWLFKSKLGGSTFCPERLARAKLENYSYTSRPPTIPPCLGAPFLSLAPLTPPPPPLP